MHHDPLDKQGPVVGRFGAQEWGLHDFIARVPSSLLALCVRCRAESHGLGCLGCAADPLACEVRRGLQACFSE